MLARCKARPRKRDYWLKLELADPLGMIGRTIPSTHCPGRDEIIIKFDLPGAGGDPYGHFTSRCGCGMIVNRQRATGIMSYAMTPPSRKRVREIEQMALTIPLVRDMLRYRRDFHKVLKRSEEFFRWRVVFDAVVLREMRPDILKALRAELRLTLKDFRESLGW